MKSSANEIRALLTLNAVPGVGSYKTRALVSYFSSAAAVLRASPRELTEVSGIDVKTAANIANNDADAFVDDQLRRMATCDAKILTLWDQRYPELLREIYDPPVLLFVRGKIIAGDRDSVAIVGTRKPSHYGKLVAEKLARDLVGAGVTVVSGLANGIDTVAHATSVVSGGRTIAVLGSGVDVIYPGKNFSLAKEITASGALVSEFPLGTQPDRPNFPRRNRIVCGMSLGVIVVEAGEKSGALITADMALEQNREVFAVPGNINSPQSIGPNELIKHGAKTVTCADDVFEEIECHLLHTQPQDRRKTVQTDLTSEEMSILKLLSHEPAHVDQLAINANETTARVLAILLSLELKNQIKQIPGKMFIRL
jgi:DNA processing protein